MPPLIFPVIMGDLGKRKRRVLTVEQLVTPLLQPGATPWSFNAASGGMTLQIRPIKRTSAVSDAGIALRDPNGVIVVWIKRGKLAANRATYSDAAEAIFGTEARWLYGWRAQSSSAEAKLKRKSAMLSMRLTHRRVVLNTAREWNPRLDAALRLGGKGTADMELDELESHLELIECWETP